VTCGLAATADADTGAVDLPLFKHDLQADGLLEPTRLFAPTRAPRRAVMCFFQEVIDKFGDNPHATLTHVYRGRPMYETERLGNESPSSTRGWAPPPPSAPWKRQSPWAAGRSSPSGARDPWSRS